MEVKYSELEDEVRDGFYIDSLMKCCWMASLKVLEEIDRICKKHNIQYQAEWGTLLGTVRHGGFIPWDDDMDISMKRPDYNKFLKVAPQEFPKDYHIINYHNDDDYWDVMSRVINDQAIHFDKEFLEENYFCPFVAGVDIFPLDYFPTKEGEADVLKDLIQDVKNTADGYGLGFYKGEELEIRLQQLEILCNMKIKREGDLRENLYDIVTSLYSLYHDEEADKIVNMPLWVETQDENLIFPKEFYSKTVRLPFDRITIPVPIAYDSVLKQKYGDYMKMNRKGSSHDYPYYGEQIKAMEEAGLSFHQYHYEDRVIREKTKQSDKKITLDAESLNVLENAHLGLCKLLLVQETETAMQLLISCQNCALSLGENIERETADCEKVISALEEYCEGIFQIYELLLQGENMDPEGVLQVLQEQLSKIRQEFSKEYHAKKKIVFIVDKASRWNSLEGIWKKVKEEKNTVVTVVAVPYYYKRMDGVIVEIHEEKDLFPAYVEVQDYQFFDLEKYHPDTIYINSPYDEYNYFCTIHPHFYSSNLVKYCEELIYVPWFVISELTREDERGWRSMQYFVTMPGVVNADKVFVQSEQMKEAYVEYLTDWAGEDTRNIWEKKIKGSGSFLLKERIQETEIPEKWKKYIYKADGSRKKIVLYNINSSSFIDYKEKAVNKLKKVLEIFHGCQEDICLLWDWDTIMEKTLQETYPELWKAYREIAAKFQQENWGIYQEDIDLEIAVSISDAYYGDGCKMSHEMTAAKKPVMLQNYDC